MALLPRGVLVLFLSVICPATLLAQHLDSSQLPSSTRSFTDSDNMNAVSSGGASGLRAQVAAAAVEGGWFFRHYALGTWESPLGIGGRFAVSLSSSLNLRAGASYFSFSTDRTAGGIPYSANVRLQSEQAVVDWYPFHNNFHVTPGVLFGSSNRAFGGATVSAGDSFTLNGVTYYSGAADPIQASGSVNFRSTAPMLTLGWGNWIRRAKQSHWAYPFEFGVAFMGDPKTSLNYVGQICTDAGQVHCQDATSDAEVQANIEAERVKLQNDANWARFYPIIAGGLVYRF